MAIQVAGVLLSGFLVMVTYLNPGQVEDRYQQFAFTEVERAADANWDDIRDDGPLEKFRALAGSLADKAARIEDKRQELVHTILANALSERCADECSPWVTETRKTDSVMIGKISGLRLGQTSLQDFIVGRYDRAVSGLTADLRRFGLVNLVVLSLALALIVTRRTPTTRLAIFSVAVTAYTAWAAYDYLFQQDWEKTILLRDWAASSYQFWMICVACVLADWVFLKGRITEFVGNAIASAFPSG